MFRLKISGCAKLRACLANIAVEITTSPRCQLFLAGPLEIYRGYFCAATRCNPSRSLSPNSKLSVDTCGFYSGPTISRARAIRYFSAGLRAAAGPFKV